MNRMWRMGVIVALIAVACRAEVNLVIDLEEDSSGTFAAEFGFDEEFQQLLELGAEGQDITENLFDGFDLEVPGATTREEVRGDMTFFIASAPFSNLPDLDSTLFADAGEDNPFESLSLEIDEDGAALDALLSIPDATEGIGQGEDLPFDPEQFTSEIFAFNLIVGMPGTVTEHNADEQLADGRLRWSIPLTGGDVAVMAVSDFGGAGFPIWLIVVLVLVALAIVAAIVVTSLRRNRNIAAIEAAGDDTDAPAGGFEAPAATAASPWGAAPEPAPVDQTVSTAVAERSPDVPDQDDPAVPAPDSEQFGSDPESDERGGPDTEA